MSKRPPNELESRLHKAILSTPNKVRRDNSILVGKTALKTWFIGNDGQGH